MSKIAEELLLNYTEEDIKNLANIFLKFFIKIEPSKINAVVFVASEPIEIESLEEISNYVDLDKFSEEVLGFTDPIGQLAKWLSKQFSWIVSAISNVVKSIIEGIVSGLKDFISLVRDAVCGLVNNLWNWLKSAIDGVLKGIESVGASILKVFSNIVSTLSNIGKTILSSITNIINTIGKQIANIGAIISKTFSNIVSSIVGTLTRISSAIMEAITHTFSTIVSTISNIFSNISRMISSVFSNFVKTILGAFHAVASGIMNAINSAFRTISSFFSEVYKVLGNIAGTIIRSITSVFSRIVGFVTKGISSVINFISNAFRSIYQFFSKLSSYIYNAFSNFIKSVYKALSGIASTIVHTVTTIFSNIVKGIESFGHTVYTFFIDVANKIKAGFALIGHALTGFINAILQFPNWFPKWFEDHIAKPIVQGLKTFANWIWEAIPNYIKNVFKVISDFFTHVWKDIVDFFTKTLPKFFTHDLPNFFTNLPKEISNAIHSLGKFIWEHLPKEIKNYFEFLSMIFSKFGKDIETFFFKDIPNFFRDVSNFFSGLVKDPVHWLYEHVFVPVMSFLTKVGETVYNGLMNFVKVVSNAVSTFIHDCVSFLYNIAKGIASAFGALFRLIYNSISNCFELIKNNVTGIKTSQVWLDIFTKVMVPLSSVGGIVVGASFPIVEAIGPVLVARMLSRLLPKLRVLLRPLGVGASFDIDIKDIAEDITKFFTKIGEHVVVESIAIPMFWFARPLEHLGEYAVRNIFPTEIPTVHETIEIANRIKTVIGFEKVSDILKNILALRGFSDDLIAFILSTVEENVTKIGVPMIGSVQVPTFFTIVDRFGTARKVPITLLYKLPTHSEIVRFMMRDVIELNDFVKLMSLHGVYKDIAYMLYFLHFKYPPVEKLWEFICRCISGETWYKIPRDILAKIQNECKIIGAFIPVDPSDLGNAISNPKIASLVFSALSQYMKWIDYASFSWIQGFTSDNALITDTLADIPTKLDIRYMLRWGIFYAWSAWGVKGTTRIEDITKNYLNKTAEPVYKSLIEQISKPVVSLDLTQMCRMLQADKIHPYWVPWIAIAETMNVFTSERTLLRTGFWNMFKEGIITKDILDNLLSGFFTISFNVQYFDLDKYAWVPATVELPIMFLPPEAKLLELRCVMDRVVELYRLYFEQVFRGVRLAIFSESDSIKLIESFVNGALSNHFNDLIYSITGKKLSLKIDLSWLSLYNNIAQVARLVESYERARNWYSRVIGWILYRVARSAVPKDLLVNFVNEIKDIAKLTDQEVKALINISNFVYELGVREYIPTPLELIRIVEYVPSARALFDEIIKYRHVPKEIAEIFRKLLYVRPVIDEVRRFISRLISSFSYGVINTSTFMNIMNSLKIYGYEQAEIEFLYKTASLYRAQRIFEQIIPSYIGLTTYFRYVPESLSFLLYKLETILNDPSWRQFLNNIDVKKIVDFYVRLAINRSVYTDMRSYIRTLIRAYEYGIIDRKKLEDELKSLTKFGLNEYNIEFILKEADLRKKIREHYHHYYHTEHHRR